MKSSRVAGSLILFLLLSAAVAAAQSDYTIIRTLFLPSVFYVGDQVEARITIRTSATDELSPPEITPTVGWAEFQPVRLVAREDGWDVRVIFTAFETGTHTLPSLNLGPVSLSGVDIHVRSILGDRVGELAPPRAQLLLPSTRLFFAMAAGIAVFIPLAWFTFVRWGRRKVGQLVALYRRRRPYRKLAKSFRALGAQAGEMEGRSFYRDLMMEMRTYLSAKLGTDCMSATTSELETYLVPVVRSADRRREIVEVFKTGDLVKFASRASTASERQNHLDLLDRATGTIEAEQRSAERSRKGRTSDVGR